MIWKFLQVAFLAVGTTHSVLVAGYNVTDEMLHQIKDQVKRQCALNGYEDKVVETENAVMMFFDCVATLPDPEIVVKEYSDARSNNTLPGFFKKYCAISPRVKVCLSPLFHVSPCMPPDVRYSYDFVVNKIDALVDFVCYKEAERPILFFAEGGAECISKKNSPILDCIFGNIPDNTKKCAIIDEKLACIVTAMEDCSSHIPSELTNSLFKTLWKPELCNEKDWNPPNQKY